MYVNLLQLYSEVAVYNGMIGIPEQAENDSIIISVIETVCRICYFKARLDVLSIMCID